MSTQQVHVFLRRTAVFVRTVRLSTEKRHISAQKLDFYAEHEVVSEQLCLNMCRRGGPYGHRISLYFVLQFFKIVSVPFKMNKVFVPFSTNVNVNWVYDNVEINI